MSNLGIICSPYRPPMAVKVYILWLMCLIYLQPGLGRIHKLEVKHETRRYIPLSSFGYYIGGVLEVNLTSFHATPLDDKAVFGFSLDRTLSDAMNPYLDSHQDGCLLQEPQNQDSGAIAYMTLDFHQNRLRINCSKGMQGLNIYGSQSEFHSDSTGEAHDIFNPRQRRHSSDSACSSSNNNIIKLKKTISSGQSFYDVNFVMFVERPSEEGSYNLFFHSCPNYEDKEPVYYDFTIEIEEKNGGNYLSAGEMPLPALYFMMALLFFLSGCFWVFILKKSRHPVYKIHYLMAVLVYLKSFSLLFHGINYHFIQTKGEHVAAWAILYYVTHLLKGAVLFITILLIGTGWTFVKPILSEKDKKTFMIVIPLQVLANVAEIIIEESEEGTVEHHTWRDVFILVDLICCGAILFPVVWSIRHLQEASYTDGKAAINLRKLKLFRHFYIMIVCYIYFTRIIVYLLKITVPFQYEWLDEMFREMATYVFFVLTGYKFRPASANPYFQVTNEDDDEDMDVVVSQSGLTEGLSKIARTTKVNEEGSDEEKDNLMSKRESSHEYD